MNKPTRPTARERHEAILRQIDEAVAEYNLSYLDDPYALAVRRGVITGQFV